MTRFVIGPDTALEIARRQALIPAEHQLFAPTLFRSQVLAHTYQQVQSGRLARREADECLEHIRKLPLRLLGDRVLQRVAWRVAAKMGWPDTFLAEYVALTKLQADALVVRDEALAAIAGKIVTVRSLDFLLEPGRR